jgi:hypothetical protein
VLGGCKEEDKHEAIEEKLATRDVVIPHWSHCSLPPTPPAVITLSTAITFTHIITVCQCVAFIKTLQSPGYVMCD